MSDWKADILLPGFEVRRIELPRDYDGEVVATLVRKPGPPRDWAVLYVHGFIDYFFQTHMASRFVDERFAFYALDLRKHGRSLLEHQHPCFCFDVTEYFAEITHALEVIASECSTVLLAGHSTGGLICALYAHQGEGRRRVAALWLNSPFLDFKASLYEEIALSLVAAAGRFAPFMSLRATVSPFYVMSLHREYCGEWDFDLRLKPSDGFPVYFGWIRAIRAAHAQLRKGLAISCPVLSMHSDRSDGGSRWKEAFRTADLVLDVDDIRRWSPLLGNRVTVREIENGVHDLVLSRRDVREAAFKELFSWLRADAAFGSRRSRFSPSLDDFSL